MRQRSEWILQAALVLMLAASTGAVAHSSANDDVPKVESPTEGRAVPIEVTPRTRGKKAAEWVVLPIPKASPAIGGGLQLIGAHFFQADPESQPSVVGIGAGYYSSETWFIGAGGGYNFAEDRWRISGGIGYLDAKYDFYGVGNDAGDNGVVFPINQTGTAAFVTVLRQLGKGWYLGGGYRYFDSKIGLRVSVPGFPEIEEIIREGVRVVSVGPTLTATYDTRDLNMNPRTGSYVRFDALFPSNSWASDETYQRATIKANRYWPIGEKYVVAGRISACGTSDNTPFFDLCFYGADSDLRGYTAGRYQDQTMIATQAELRVQFAPRWGGVVFGGVGQVAASFGDMNSDNLLPAGGFGIRWMAATANKVNIRADFAWGQGEDALFYLSIGEAF